MRIRAARQQTKTLSGVNRWWQKVTYPRTPERVFALLYTVFGLLFLVIIPPMQVADESSHTFRAYQVSRGHFVTEHTTIGSGGSLPSGLVQFVQTADIHASRPLNDRIFRPRQTWPAMWRAQITDKYQATAFDNTAIYPPVNYVVPAVGMDVAHLFTNRPVVLFYMARLANFAFLGAALFFAIRWLTRGKWALVVIGLLPMVLYEAVSVSADVYLLAMAALFVGYWSRLYAAAAISRKQWAVIGVLAVLLALSKQSYAVFVPMLLLLSAPVWKQRSERQKRLLIGGGICAVALLAAVGWFIASSTTNADFVHWASSYGPVINPATQQAFILHHPVSFLAALGNTLFTNNVDGLVFSFLGNFGWLDTPLPLTLSFGSLLVLFLSFGWEKVKKPPFSRATTLILCGLAVTALLVLAAGLYMYWTPVGSGLVLGFQGRYFIPMLILLVPVLAGRYTHSISKRTVFSLLIAVLIGMLIVLGYRYYTLPSFI